jgi:hypothetical protein
MGEGFGFMRGYKQAGMVFSKSIVAQRGMKVVDLTCHCGLSAILPILAPALSEISLESKKDSRQAGMTKINQDSGPILVKAKISARMTFLEHVLPVLIELAWWRNRWN